jgi:type II secretory pathway pseudopilin PulG
VGLEVRADPWSCLKSRASKVDLTIDPLEMHPARSTPAQIARAARRALLRVARRGAVEDAFTLIETLIASVVLVVGVAAFFNSLSVSTHAQASSRAREGATNLAREILEDARTIPYAQLAPYSIEHELQQMPGLASSSPQAWTVVRRGFTYAVTVSECAIDDPKDGYGVHDSTFCPESLEHAPSNPPDPAPADLKRITLDVKWHAQGRSPDVHEVETLTAAGQSIGLSASNLHVVLPPPGAEKPTAPLIRNPALTELEFSVTAPIATAAMDWELEGVRQSPQPTKTLGSNTEWTFRWKIPYPAVSDGTYAVTAQAIDSTGVEGPPVSITVTLLRGSPVAPKGLVGGFNIVNVAGNQTRVVELQWHANSERNVVGYRVYGPGGLVCPRNAAGEPSMTTLSLSLSCIDLHAPAYNATNISYEVAALYHEAEAKEELSTNIAESARAVLNVPSGEPVWPSAPAPLSATKNEDGSVTLTWPKVEGAAFYRIYRGSTEYTSRYGTAPQAGIPEFVDTDATAAHEYWVTAVSSNLAESSPSKPVTK